MNILESEVTIKVNELVELKNKLNLKYSIFVIGNTRVEGNVAFYWTPFRKSREFILIGIVLFSEEEAKIVLKLIDGLVDYIYVDCEKKSKNTNAKGLFNFERLSYEIVNNSFLRFYKGNDITTEALDTLVNSFFLTKKRLMGGSKILIIGMGNLGFKICLKFVERGAHVFVMNRSEEKAKKLIEAINIVKPKETISNVEYINHKMIEKCFTKELDVMLLCYSERFIGLEYLFQSIVSKTIIVDVGKGCISSEQFAQLISRKTQCFRLDVGDTLIDFIENDIALHKKPIKKVENEFYGRHIILRGIIGLKNDIVVDDVENPSFVYGICDGQGGFMTNLSVENKRIINKLKNKCS